MITSSALVGSIRPTVVTAERVVIAAGNDRVNYAKAHNEGWVGNVNVRAHQRKIKGKAVQVRQHQRLARIVKRQFMGNSRQLNLQILRRINGYLNSLQ